MNAIREDEMDETVEKARFGSGREYRRFLSDEKYRSNYRVYELSSMFDEKGNKRRGALHERGCRTNPQAPRWS